MKEQLLSRRNLLGTTAAIAVGATTVTSIRPATQAAADEAMSYEADVLVIGGGAGGIIAACSAADEGAKVVLLEATPRIGGTSLMCQGHITTHGASDFESLMKAFPLTDPAMGKKWLEIFPELYPWFDASGIPYSVIDDESIQLGAELAPAGNLIFFGALTDRALSTGVEILYSHTAKELLTNEAGAVVGCRAQTADGATVKVAAGQTILACGGFQANKDLNVAYVAPYADLMVSRGNPNNQGMGLIMAAKVGAAASRGGGTFYGHPVPMGIECGQEISTWNENICDDEWVAKMMTAFTLAQNSGWQNGIAVNLDGKRFFDETKASELFNQAVAQQHFARAYEIIDAQIRDDKTGMTAAGVDVVEYMQANGVDVVVADTIEELVEQLGARGVAPVALQRTINGYNEAVDAGTTAELDVPKDNAEKAMKLGTAPFYAWPVVPGNSFTYGGVKVNLDSQAVDQYDAVIPGLWAIPGTAGGMQYDLHVGCLSTICAFGHSVGVSAAKASVR